MSLRICPNPQTVRHHERTQCKLRINIYNVLVTYRYRLIGCNKCTTLMPVVDNGDNYTCACEEGVYGNSVLPARLFYKPKTAQKSLLSFKKKCISRSEGIRITQVSLKIRTRLPGCLEETKTIFKLLSLETRRCWSRTDRRQNGTEAGLAAEGTQGTSRALPSSRRGEGESGSSHAL